MRRRPHALLVVALAGLALACTKKKASTPTSASSASRASTAAGPSDTILIGEVGSLSGSEATFGISTRNGIEMAIDEANEEGGVKGKKLLVRVYDDMGRPEEAANAVTRLINEDHVKLILGEVASSNSLAMARKAQPSHVPMITPSSTSPEVTRIGDYIFRVCFTDTFQGYVMAKFASENLHLKTAAILEDNRSDYSLGLTDVFTRKFTEMGGKVVSLESYSKGDSDFRAQLTAIKRSHPQAIFIPGYYQDVGLIARQARELGIDVPLLGGDGWESEKLYELGGSALDGSYYSNHYSPEDPTPRVQQFIAAYKHRYGAVPDSMAALGYDAARVGVEAMRRAPELSGPEIRDAIAKTKDFPGVAGVITLDAHRNTVKPAVVLEVKDNQSKYVTTIQP